jgi:hypothetical protein
VTIAPVTRTPRLARDLQLGESAPRCDAPVAVHHHHSARCTAASGLDHKYAGQEAGSRELRVSRGNLDLAAVPEIRTGTLDAGRGRRSLSDSSLHKPDRGCRRRSWSCTIRSCPGHRSLAGLADQPSHSCCHHYCGLVLAWSWECETWSWWSSQATNQLRRSLPSYQAWKWTSNAFACRCVLLARRCR